MSCQLALLYSVSPEGVSECVGLVPQPFLVNATALIDCLNGLHSRHVHSPATRTIGASGSCAEAAHPRLPCVSTYLIQSLVVPHQETVKLCVLMLCRYELPAAVGPRSSGLSFGPLPSELYSMLSSGASGYSLGSMAGFNSRQGRPKHKVCIVTGEGSVV